MRKYNKITLLTLIFGIFVQSCSIDKVQPINALTEENVITNEATAQSVLNNVYAKYRTSFFIPIAGYMFEFLGDGLENLYPNSFGSGELDLNDVREENDFITTIYSDYYQIINQANWFIKLMEEGKAQGVTEVRKNEMLAEARFMRALGHFNLLRTFGQFYDLNSTFGIIVRTSPAKGLDITARATVQQSYNAILNDLKFAKENGAVSVPHWKASRTTAAALLAKVYLYMGDFPNAEAEALAVLNNTDGYTLESSYADVFKNRFDSRETLFSPFVDGVNETSNSYFILLSNFSSYFNQIADAGVAGVGDLNGNGSGYDPRFAYTYADNTKGVNESGKFPQRFSDPTGTQGTTFYPLRLAEIYLIYAEASARTSASVSPEAVIRVNEIRKRAGAVLQPIAPTTKKELLMAIYDEKLLELAGENGEHWFDMVRYDRLGDLVITDYKPTVNDINKLIMPIPRTARAGNNLLVPNPGY